MTKSDFYLPGTWAPLRALQHQATVLSNFLTFLIGHLQSIKLMHGLLPYYTKLRWVPFKMRLIKIDLIKNFWTKNCNFEWTD